MAKNPKPLPMPVELVLHSKHLAIAPGSVHRAICSICMLVWSSGNPPPAIDESTAQQIAKIPGGHWSAIKAPVMAALADILPELSAAHVDAAFRKAHVKAFFANAGRNNAGNLKSSQKKQLSTKPENKNPASIPPLLVTPRHARLFQNDGRTLQSPQELAVIGKVKQNDMARLIDD